jgi:hypothetical protein
MSRRFLPFAAVAATFLALPPDARGAVPQGPVVRDSAGVQIVLNPSRRVAPVAFAIGMQSVLDIGGMENDPEQEFDHNKGYLRAARLSDGRLAVIDVTRIHYFTPNGRRLQIVGRKGQGPGEFLYIMTICATRGDTIIINDSHNRRMSVLDGRGTFVRHIPQEENGSMGFDSCFDDGTFLLQQRVGRFVPGGPPPQTRLTRMRTDGQVVEVLPELASAPFDMVSMTEATIQPFGNQVWYGNGLDQEVRVYDAKGALRRIIRTDDAPVRITDAEAEQRMSSTIPNNVSAAERNTRMTRMKAMPHATHWPAFARLIVGSDGKLWMQHFRSEYPSEDVWTAFDSTGRLVGNLVLPAPTREARMDVQAFGANDVLVRRFDENRATYLSIYPLNPVGGRKP